MFLSISVSVCIFLPLGRFIDAALLNASQNRFGMQARKDKIE